MPLSFRIGQIIILLQILCVTALNAVYPFMMGTARGELDLVDIALLIACVFGVFGAAGLVRRVAWGRFFSSCFGVIMAFFASSQFMPNPDCPPDDLCSNPLLFLTGHEPSALFNWLVVVLAPLFYLLPQLMVGWHKDYFRNQWW